MKNIFILFVLVTGFLFSQKNMDAHFDYAVFMYDNDSSFIELYYSFSGTGMTKNVDSDKEYVEAKLELTVTKIQKKSKVLLNDSWNVKQKYGEKTLTGLLSFTLPHGNYTFDIKLSDMHNPKIYADKSLDVNVREPNDDIFAISDIEIAQELVQFSNNKESIFYKNTLEVIPNPSLVFGEGIPILYFYTEFYNLQKEMTAPALKVAHQLFNSYNHKVYEKEKFINRKSNSAIDIGAINVMKYPTGSYTLKILLTDTTSNKDNFVFRKLFIVNPSVKDTIDYGEGFKDAFETELAGMDEKELDEYFDYSDYLALPSEISMWDKLRTEEGKRQFLYKFWLQRDVEPETKINEYKIEYFDRIKYADKAFSCVVFNEGHRSDRGRVYAIYGKPSDVHNYPMNSDELPYEVWQYDDLQGGCYFVFVDFNANRNYKLISSTKRGEIYDEYWKAKIQRVQPTYNNRATN